MPTQILPHLIQTTLDFYRWRTIVRDLNREYFEEVNLVTGMDRYMELYWVKSGADIIKTEATTEFRLWRIRVGDPKWFPKVRSFLNCSRSVECPSKYYYSSGMYHPTAYKNY